MDFICLNDDIAEVGADGMPSKVYKVKENQKLFRWHDNGYLHYGRLKTLTPPNIFVFICTGTDLRAARAQGEWPPGTEQRSNRKCRGGTINYRLTSGYKWAACLYRNIDLPWGIKGFLISGPSTKWFLCFWFATADICSGHLAQSFSASGKGLNLDINTSQHS